MDDYLGGAGDPFATVSGGFGVDYAAMNKGVQPIFFVEPVPDERASERDGVPRYREEERVRLIVAGDMFNQPVHPVDSSIKERFPEHYAKWKASKAQKHVEGTPLKEWPLLSPAQVAEFDASGIYSIESLRDLSDTNVNRIHDGRIWREKAKAWLEQAKDGAAATRLAAENERLREQIEHLEKRFNELEQETLKRPAGKPKAA
jgi:hypothetical protein